MTIKKYGLLLLLLLITIVGAKAQVTFNLQVPAATVKGNNFQIAYRLTIKGDAEGQIDDIKAPQKFDNFEFVFGPVTSQSSSTFDMNGKVSREVSVAYIYTLNASKEGTFDIPGATIKFGGKTYNASPRKMKVLPPDKNAQQPMHPGQQQEAVSSSSTAEKIDPTDIFVRAIFSKTKVAEQEAVVVTFRIYTSIPIRQVTGVEFPEFEGFITDEFDLRNLVNWTLEHYNGRNYQVADIKKTLLFAQRSGKITIPSGKVDFVVAVKSGQKIVIPGFGPQDIGAEVAKSLKTNPVTVNVSELPETKPLNFSGAVGSFTVNSTITTQKITANEPVTIKMEVKGTGNLKLVKNPELKLPKEFEVYDPKVNNDYKLTEKGQSGTKTIEYMFIPRTAGKFTIPAVEFSYYDVDSKTYKTLSTEEFVLDVAKDPNAGNNTSATSYSTQNEVKVEQDIRYLKTAKFLFGNASYFIVAQATYWLWYIAPFLFFIVFIIVNRNRVKANADVTRMRTRKANRVAAKRLKQAAKYLKIHNKDGFYEEVLRAVWGYLSDKLTIPVADLSRENVEAELTKYGADETLIARFIEVLDTAEFARYSPAESNKAMDNLYDEAVNAIGKMENTVKIKL